MTAPRRAYERPVGVAPNYAQPRICIRMQHAHTASEQRIYEALEKSAQPVKAKSGWQTIQRSYAQIVAMTGMAPSTVRDNVRRLIAKESITPWNARSGEMTGRRRRGDHGDVTTYLLRTYREVLEARRGNATIGTTRSASGRLHTWVIGKGRRFLSQDELIAWKVDPAAAFAIGPRAAAPGASAQDFADDMAAGAPPEAHAQPPPETRAQPPPAAIAQPPPEPELEPLKDALIDVCGAADTRDAALVWAAARRESGIVPLDAVIPMIAAIGKVRRHNAPHAPITPGLVKKLIPGHVAAWKKKHGDERRAEAKAAAIARDQRVNRYAGLLRQRGDPALPESDRALIEDVLQHADPAEVELARALIKERTMTA